MLLANVQDNVHVVEHASVAALDWGIPSEREAMARQNFQVVVASDVIYEEQNIDPFIRTLGAIWDSSSTVALTVHCILALKKRDLAAEVLEQFFARLEVAGFTANEVSLQSFVVHRGSANVCKVCSFTPQVIRKLLLIARLSVATGEPHTSTMIDVDIS